MNRIERHRIHAREWARRNRAYVTQKAIEWRRANPEAAKAICKRSREKRAEKINEATARYRAAKTSAVPTWIGAEHRKAIADLHREARRLSVETGIPHQVDHIIPLRGKGVCGLHVPWNMQILPAVENIRKGNRV